MSQIFNLYLACTKPSGWRGFVVLCRLVVQANSYSKGWIHCLQPFIRVVADKCCAFGQPNSGLVSMQLIPKSYREKKMTNKTNHITFTDTYIHVVYIWIRVAVSKLVVIVTVEWLSAYRNRKAVQDTWHILYKPSLRTVLCNAQCKRQPTV